MNSNQIDAILSCRASSIIALHRNHKNFFECVAIGTEHYYLFIIYQTVSNRFNGWIQFFNLKNGNENNKANKT